MKPDCYTHGYSLAMSHFNLDVKEVFGDKMEFSISNYDQKVYHCHNERGSVVVAHMLLVILRSLRHRKHYNNGRLRKSGRRILTSLSMMQTVSEILFVTEFKAKNN